MAEERPRAFALIRAFSPADFITLANAACGTISIFLCLQWIAEEQADPYLKAAFLLLPLALFFDMADGHVARRQGRSSPYGADLDSLADIVSFGVAPAVLAFALGMRGAWDSLVLVWFVCCGIGRLARFNVTAESLSDDRGKVAYFEGTPIPTSLLLVALLAVAWWQGAVGDQLWGGSIRFIGLTLHPLVLVFGLSGGAMISEKLRIPKP